MWVMPESSLRASDQERDVAVMQLREHCAAGRLSLEELDQRVGRAYEAMTRAELAGVLEDLPTVSSARQVRGDRRVFWPGVSAFNEVRHLSASCVECYDSALREIVPRLGTHGYV